MIGMTNENNLTDFLQYYDSIKDGLNTDNVYMNKRTYDLLNEEILQALKERNIGVVKTEYIEDNMIYFIPKQYISIKPISPSIT